LQQSGDFISIVLIVIRRPINPTESVLGDLEDERFGLIILQLDQLHQYSAKLSDHMIIEL
jgi:hypothetical protein